MPSLSLFYPQLHTSQLHSEMESTKQLLTLERDTHVRRLEEEKQSLAARLSELQSTIQEHEDCISRLQSDHEKSQEEADQLSSQLETLTQELKDKEAEILALRGQQSRAPEGLEESESAKLQLRQEVSSLPKAEEQWKAQLAGMEKSLAELQQPGGGGPDAESRRVEGNGNQIRLLEEQVLKLRSENESLIEELLKTQSKSGSEPPAREKSDTEELQHRIQDLEQKLQLESAKRKQLQDHLVQTSAEHDQELSQLVSEKEGLQDDVGTLREELSRTLQLQNDSLSEGSQLKLENSQLFEDLSEQKETISKLRAEVEMLRSDREERRVLPTDGKVEQTQMQVAEGVGVREKQPRQDLSMSGFDDIDLGLYQDLSTASGVNVHLIERLQDLVSVVAEKERVISKMRVSTAALESSEVALQESVDGLQSEKSGLEERLQVVAEENRELVTCLQNELEAAKQKARQEVADLQSAAQNREERITELERESETLKSEAVERDKMALEILDLQTQLGDKAQMVSHHEQNLRELGEMLAAREREVAELRAQCKEGRAKEGTLLAECQRVREENAVLLEQMAHVEQEARLSKVEFEAALEQGEATVAESVEESLHEEKAALEQKLAQVILERDRLIANLRGKEDELTLLTAASNQMKQQLSQSHLETASKTSEVDELSRELTTLRPQLNSLRKEKGELEARLGALEERGVTTQRELEGRLVTKEAECARYTRELERLRAHLIEVSLN